MPIVSDFVAFAKLIAWFRHSDSPSGYPVIDATAIDTTDLAAISAWHILQGFYSGLPQLDSKVGSKSFNLFTESYGGHYGPSVSAFILVCSRALRPSSCLIIKSLRFLYRIIVLELSKTWRQLKRLACKARADVCTDILTQFYNYFYDQNQLIANGTMQGTQLNFDTLGIINGRGPTRTPSLADN